jgi:hypothetical protein
MIKEEMYLIDKWVKEKDLKEYLLRLYFKIYDNFIKIKVNI